MLQMQVMREMDLVSQSLGITDDLSFTQMLNACCNPQAIVMRNKQVLKGGKDPELPKLPIREVVTPVKQIL